MPGTSQNETMDAMGRLLFADGSSEYLSETHVQRVVYALTTIVLHKAVAHIGIVRVESATGQLLWQHPSPAMRDQHQL